MKKNIKLLGEYVGHLVLGAIMFTLLLLFGGGLNKLVHFTAPFIGDSSFSDLMKLVETVILYADVTFVVWWAAYSTYQLVKGMMNHE